MAIGDIVQLGYGGTGSTSVLTLGYLGTSDVVPPPPPRPYRRTERPRMDLRIYTPLPSRRPLARALFDGGAQVAIGFTTQLSTGFGRLTFGRDDYNDSLPLGGGRRDAGLPHPVQTTPFGHVTLHVEGTQAFVGQLGEDSDTDGDIRSGKAFGYGVDGLRDSTWRNPPGGDPIPAGSFLRQAIERAAPRLGTSADWPALTGKYRGTEAALTHPATLLDMAAESDPIYWVVYEDQLVRLIRRAAPAQPTYHVTSGIRRSRSYVEMYTHVEIDLGTDDAPNVLRIPGPLTPGTLGFERVMPLPMTAPPGEQLQYVQQWLERHAVPAITIYIEVDNFGGLPLFGGGSRAPWLVRAGESVMDKWGNIYLITGTSWDGWRGTLEVNLGEPLPGSVQRALTVAATTAAAVRDGRDPRTRTKSKR